MPQAAVPFVAPIAGSLIGDMLGGSSPQASQAVPPQLQGMNQKSIQGLMTLLGFGGPNPWAPQQGGASSGFGQPRQIPGSQGFPINSPQGYFNAPGLATGNQSQQAPQMQSGQMGGGMFGNLAPMLQQLMSPQAPQANPASQLGYGYGGITPNASGPGSGTLQGITGGPQGGMSAQLPGNVGAFLNGGAGMASPVNGGQGVTGSPMDQMFGNLGQPLTQLQQQTLGGMSNLFNSPAPEMQALQQSMPMLQNLLGNNPGAPVISALKPFMQQGLSMANQQGGRFGSANALRQSQVMNDYGLLAAQAAQQGVNQQLAGANQLGILSSAAGNNPFNRLMGGFNAGQSAAQQNDVGLQRALQLMSQAAFGQPTVVSPSGMQQGSQIGGQVGSILAMLGNGQGFGSGSGIPAAPTDQPWMGPVTNPNVYGGQPLAFP